MTKDTTGRRKTVGQTATAAMLRESMEGAAREDLQLFTQPMLLEFSGGCRDVLFILLHAEKKLRPVRVAQYWMYTREDLDVLRAARRERGLYVPTTEQLRAARAKKRQDPAVVPELD